MSCAVNDKPRVQTKGNRWRVAGCGAEGCRRSGGGSRGAAGGRWGVHVRGSETRAEGWGDRAAGAVNGALVALLRFLWRCQDTFA